MTATTPVAMTARYALISTRLAYRNVRFLVLTVALPLLLFLLYANLYRGQDAGDGLTVVAYLMVSMASFGCIGAAINTGARIAIERQVGWNRQLRLTALRALLARFPQAHDIEIATGNLEDAFLELVATSRQEAAR